MNNCFSIGKMNMPVLGLGSWQLKGIRCIEVVSQALDLGYRHIDTASMYRNQTEIGKALQACKTDRSELFLTSKIWLTELGKKATAQSLETALKELRTEYLDLFLIHWPGYDRKKRLESYEAMLLEREKGRLKSIGVSNFSVAQMREIKKEFGEWPAVNQIPVNPLSHDEPELQFLLENNIIITAYSPLDKGDILGHPKLRSLAEKYRKTPAQIVLRWIIDRGIAAIPKAADLRHLKSNSELFDFQLSAGDFQALSRFN